MNDNDKKKNKILRKTKNHERVDFRTSGRETTEKGLQGGKEVYIVAYTGMRRGMACTPASRHVEPSS